MRSNNSDVAVVDAADCGSGGGGLAQLRLDRAATAESARWRRGSGAGAVGRCERGVLAQRDGDGGVSDGGRPMPVVIRRRASIC
jgi:hypothetical protein